MKHHIKLFEQFINESKKDCNCGCGECNDPIKLNESVQNISEGLKYHIDNKKSLMESIYRFGSEKHIELINEVRILYNKDLISLNESDLELIKTDIGTKAIYEDKEVWLDMPYINEAEYKGKEVKLNSPKRGGSKKYYVYVKNDKGNVVKVNFGDAGGISAKINNPKARKSFVARHDCKNKKDRTSPGYWSCNLPKYAKQLGLSGGGNFYW